MKKALLLFASFLWLSAPHNESHTVLAATEDASASSQIASNDSMTSDSSSEIRTTESAIESVIDPASGPTADSSAKELTNSAENQVMNDVIVPDPDPATDTAAILLQSVEAAAVVQEEAAVRTYTLTTVDYPAMIIRGTDAINTLPWGVSGWQTIGYSKDYMWQEVTVSQEQVASDGIVWALISSGDKQLGWITKGALSVREYIQIQSTKVTDYPATISRGMDAINSQPWGTKGYRIIGYSGDYLWKEVTVVKEQVASNGVTWSFVMLNGWDLGWIAKDALSTRDYVQIQSTKFTDYPATISRGTDAINSQPWGTKGYRTIGYSTDYLWKEVTVVKEQVASNGVTWAFMMLDGWDLGWIAKNALTVRDYVQILSTKNVSYSANIIRGSDAINTQPWGTKGYTTIGYTSSYLGGKVTVSQEKVASNGVTWVMASYNGKELGWISKSALVTPTIITFDDGLESVYTVAFPMMKARGIPGTVFVVTDKIGTSGHMTWEQLKEMQNAGWTIANHTSNHISLVKSSLSDAIRAVEEGAKALSSRGFSGAYYLAAPYNAMNATVASYFEHVVKLTRLGEVYGISKNEITHSNTTLRARSIKRYDSVQTIFTNDYGYNKSMGWAKCLNFHGIGNVADDYYYTKENFGVLLDKLISDGALFYTVDQYVKENIY